MSITVNTIYGTFVVPSEKEDSLISWLKVNAVNVTVQPVTEVKNGENTGRQLINE
jgi:hypothetical protein